jgi:beta-galactosidase
VQWQRITVPHIFRQSGLSDQSAGWYRQKIEIGIKEKGRTFFLILEGAASVKDVYVNGQWVGQHKGAYTASAFDLTPRIRLGASNTIAVRVSNRDEDCKGILARSNLYYINGGLFRPVRLVSMGAVSIFPEAGSTGVYLTPSQVTAQRADLGLRSYIRNATLEPVSVNVRHVVSDPTGLVCGKVETPETLLPGVIMPVSAQLTITRPMLWDLAKPNLYTVRTEVIVDGQISDEVTEQTGFRTIAWRDKKFYLNEREVQFRGVNKHQQNEYDWNAVSDQASRDEFKSMQEMGANFVRLCHYPHSPLEYRLADEAGLGVWAENGFAGQTWKGAWPEDKIPTSDGERLTREMVRQLWNHPSILFWSCGNETILETASRYAEVIRGEKDPNRLITYATNAGDPKGCDFVAKNTYDGWYGGNYDGFSAVPRNALVSETGAGSWLTHHVPYGTVQWRVNQFEPEEYAEMFAEYRLQTVCQNDSGNHPLLTWWVFREFYDHKLKQNRNSKGLVTMAGTPKDLYYLFQAFLNPTQPVLRLCGRNHFYRRFAPDNGLKVYANAPEVELTLNGVSQGKHVNGDYKIPDAEQKQKDGTVKSIPGITVDHVFFWKTTLRPGRNLVEVIDGRGHRDQMVVYQQGLGSADLSTSLTNVTSSNPANPAIVMDRPIEAQAPFYYDVDGTSDNTLDRIPPELEGATWIATRRLSDPTLKTDISFSLNPQVREVTVWVLFSTGTYPVITLKPPNDGVMQPSKAMAQALGAANFQSAKTKVVWRDHELNRADAALWSRQVKPGEVVRIPGQTLDYVILVQTKEPRPSSAQP